MTMHELQYYNKSLAMNFLTLRGIFLYQDLIPFQYIQATQRRWSSGRFSQQFEIFCLNLKEIELGTTQTQLK